MHPPSLQVMADPSLASGFSNPKVQSAIFDISQNPMNISKYQGDPEVMKVLEKVTEIFSPQVRQGKTPHSDGQQHVWARHSVVL